MKEKINFNKGKWKAYYDEFGICQKVVYDKDYLNIIGSTPENEYESTNIWKKIVHPEDLSLIEDEYATILDKHPEGYDCDFECRILVNGEYHMFNFVCHCERREDGSLSYITGAMFDIQDIVNARSTQKELSENYSRLFALEDDFEALYEVDLQTGNYYEFFKGQTYSEKISTKFIKNKGDFFEDSYKNIDTVTLLEDREQFKKEFNKEHIISVLEKENRYDYYYRLIVDNKPAWFKMRIVWKDSNKLSLIIGIFNAAEEMFEKQRTEALVNSFVSEYEFAFLRDLKKSKFTVLTAKDGLGNAFLNVGNLEPNIIYANKFVHPDDRSYFLSNYFNDSYLSKNLPIGKTYSFEYRSNSSGSYIWYKTVFNRISEDDVLLGIKQCDDEIVRRRVSDKVLSDFASVFVVNLKDNTYRFLSRNSDSGFADVAGGNYLETINEYISRVNVEYRNQWKNMLDFDFIRRELQLNGRIEYVYPLEEIDKRWRRCIVEKLEEEDGIPTSFIMTYYVIDDDRASNLELIKEIKEKKEELETSYEELTDARRRINLLHNTVKASIWSYSIDENDKVVAASYDEYATTEVLDKRDPMEWINYIHPEDRDNTLKQFMAAIHDHSGNTEYSPTYRIMGNGGTYKWIKTTGKLQRHEDGTSELFGISIDITNEIKAQQDRQIDIERTKKLVESVAATYDVAYAVNMNNDTYTLLKSGGNLLVDGNRFKNFTESKNELLNIVHKADKCYLEKELDFKTIKKNLKNKTSYDIEFRIVIDNGTYWHLMNVTRIDDNNIALGFADKDLFLTKNHLQEKRFEDIFGLYEADLDTGMYKIIVNSPYYTFSKTGKPVPYTDAMRTFAESQVGDTKEFFLKLSNIDYLKNLLAKDNKHYFTYQSATAKESWVDVTSYVTMRHNDGTPAMVAFEFNFVSSTGAARQEMQKKLNESNQMVSGLATGYDALYYINIDDNIFNIYTLNEEKYPSSRKAVIGKKDFYNAIKSYGLSKYVHPDDRYLFNNFSPEMIREKLTGNKKYSMRFRMETPDGYKWNEMDIIKYENANEVANIVAVGFADRDAVIRAEQEHQHQLEEAVKAAETANAAKTNFLFSMSHDIRTPMNAIMGFTNMAIKHIDDKPKAIDCLEKTQKAGDMLLSLINSVLEVSRIESGNASLDEQPGDIYYSFANIENTLHEMADLKDINLTFEFGNIRDRYVYADYNRCMRILVNIISNAIKYTPNGGKVNVKCEQIGNAINNVGQYKYIISDNGIGMSEEFQKHIFEQFARENTSTVSGIQGSGLGMSVVKSFVELMGGTIKVESKQNEGSIFTIILPFKLQENKEYIDPVTGKIVKSGKSLKESIREKFNGKKVLLVEDNELNLEIAIELLEEEGFVVDEANDGTVAVEKVKTYGPEYYDFILMDIQMPLMNGYEATKVIRKLYPRIKLPIIALSANAFEEDKRKSIESGMDDHVAKPINVKELLNVLAKYI